MRFISNLYSKGNTYSEKEGGVSVTGLAGPSSGASGKRRIPGSRWNCRKVLIYSINSPWVTGSSNAEHASDGSYRVRQLIVPGKDSKIYNSVDTWFSYGSDPVKINLTVPEYTPENDVVAIQFNPFVWMEPIPMHQEKQLPVVVHDI